MRRIQQAISQPKLKWGKSKQIKRMRNTYKQTKAKINGCIFLRRNKCESFVQITKSQKHMSIFTLFVVTCTHTIREKRAGEKTRCYKIGATLNILYLYAFFFTVTHFVVCVCVPCDIRESEMAMTTEKVRLKMKLNAESNECFAALNRPPPIFHECKTQTVKIETFDLWPTRCCCYG